MDSCKRNDNLQNVSYVFPRELFENLSEAYREVIIAKADTYYRKNKAYGSAFDKALDKFGLSALVQELFKKYTRLEHLVKCPDDCDFESVLDTILDISNYCDITLTHIKKSPCPTSL